MADYSVDATLWDNLPYAQDLTNLLGARGRLVAQRSPVSAGNWAIRGDFDYLRLGGRGFSGLLPATEPRLSRRTVRAFPLLPPPQENCSPHRTPDTPDVALVTFPGAVPEFPRGRQHGCSHRARAGLALTRNWQTQFALRFFGLGSSPTPKPENNADSGADVLTPE